MGDPRSSNSSNSSSRSNPLLHPPPRRGGGLRWGLERSVAVEPSKAIEQIERFLGESKNQFSKL